MACRLSRQLRGLRATLLRRYEHRPFVSCLVGLYGCRWRRHERSDARPGDCCCNKWEGFCLALLVAAFCLTLVFLYFWGHAGNDYNDFDWFNFGNLGFWFPWSVVLLVVAAGFFFYVSVLLLLAVCLLSEGQRLQLHWSHKTGILVSLSFSIVATAVLSDLWSKEWTTLLLSFQVTAPYLHVGGVLLMTSLAWPVALHVFRMNSRVRGGLMAGVFLTSLSVLYMLPLGLYSPCIQEEGALGPPPALIGHRGAPMLAPENTLMSFEKAVEAGSDGLETDVAISLDGVPFLMHDHTLRRTTNVRQVFPDRADEPAAMFSWAELQSLNAGAWFLSDDPFGSASSLGAAERQRAGNQSVCSLQIFLQLAAHTHRLVMFDLNRPPRGHPFRDGWVQRTLEVLHQTIPSAQVLWLPWDQRSLVQQTDPDLQQTSGSLLPLEELQRNHIVKLNLHYSCMSAQLTRAYAAANVTTNLYVISRPWLFSLAWCSGVHSVTTNAPQILSTLRSPLLLMSPDEFQRMWILTDVLSFVFIFIIFCFHRWRERRLSFCSDGRMTLDDGTYRKITTEMSDIWSVSSSKSQTEKMADLATVTERGADLATVTERGADLATVTERGADLATVMERGADLATVTERGADLATATERGADLATVADRGADLATVTERGADLATVTERGADLATMTERGADLATAADRGADLATATERGADLATVTERGADLATVTERGADLATVADRGADLATVTERGADLATATERGADLATVTERGADLATMTERGADLATVADRGADLATVTERGADLATVTERGADLATVTERGADLATMTERGADLATVTERGADLATMTERGADLATVADRGADLATVTERGADLATVTERGADLATMTERGADLATVTERGADLATVTERGADLATVTERGADLATMTERGADLATVADKGADLATQSRLKQTFSG